MSKRPFIAARWELFVDRRVERFFRMLGWQERVIPYTAYGDTTFVRVLGRVVLSPPFQDSQLGKATEEFLQAPRLAQLPHHPLRPRPLRHPPRRHPRHRDE
jgi:hypothetical protein